MGDRARAVLFDIDGVLIDSEAANMASYRSILAEFGYEVPLDRIKQAMLGGTTHRIFEALAPGSTQETRDSMVARVVQNVPYTFLQFRPTQALEAVPRISENYAIGAVTNRRKSAFDVLNHFGVLGYFSSIHTADSHPPKPSPDMVKAACASLGVKPEQAVFFGDNQVDAEAGRLAGVRTHLVGANCPQEKIFGLLEQG